MPTVYDVPQAEPVELGTPAPGYTMLTLELNVVQSAAVRQPNDEPLAVLHATAFTVRERPVLKVIGTSFALNVVQSAALRQPRVEPLAVTQVTAAPERDKPVENVMADSICAHVPGAPETVQMCHVDAEVLKAKSFPAVQESEVGAPATS